MIYVVYYDSVGRILEVRNFPLGTLTSVINAAAPAGTVGWIDDENVDPEFDYISGGVVTQRPELYETDFVHLDPVIPELPNTVTFPLPTGTIVTPSDEVSYTSGVGESFTISIEIYGEWNYSFNPPFPYLPLTLYIEALPNTIGS